MLGRSRLSRGQRGGRAEERVWAGFGCESTGAGSLVVMGLAENAGCSATLNLSSLITHFMNSVMFVALCLRRSVRDIGGSHFRPTRFQIQLTPLRNTTSPPSLSHTCALLHPPPCASRSISKHCMIIGNLITPGLSDGGPVLPNHICIEWPKAKEVWPDSNAKRAPTMPSPQGNKWTFCLVATNIAKSNFYSSYCSFRLHTG